MMIFQMSWQFRRISGHADLRMLLLVLVLGFSKSTCAQDVSDMYRKLNPTVVTIRAFDGGSGEGSQGGLGSGVIIDKEGRVMTAAHVVHTASAIVVVTSDGKVIPASVSISVPSADVALLKMIRAPSDLTPARLGNSDLALVGTPVLIIGAPFGLGHSLSVGHVSGRINQGQVIGGEVVEVIQTDAAVNQGNSGGPMFNSSGEVVGIVSSILSKSGGFEGIGFAIAINPAKRILLESPSFWTGFDAVFLEGDLAKSLNVRQRGGLLIQRVTKDSMAGQAQLRGGHIPAKLLGREFLLGGDIVLSILGTSCETPHDFRLIREELNRLQPGETFVINILRGGEEIALKAQVPHSAIKTRIND